MATKRKVKPAPMMSQKQFNQMLRNRKTTYSGGVGVNTKVNPGVGPRKVTTPTKRKRR